MASLKVKTVSGFKWLVINNVLQKVISIGTFAILARRLEPSVFGLFAMAFVAIDGLSMFKTFGLDGGLIQKKNAPESANDTALFLIEGMSIFLFIICFAFAPLIAKFFNNPQLGSVVRALGVVFILGGLARVPSALLTKSMRFRLISVIDLTGSTVNCVFAVIFSLISPSVWSLVGAYVIKQTMMTLLAWYFSGFRFKWRFDFKLAHELFHFGKYLMLLSIVSYIGGNINNIVIGKMLSVAMVGYYTLASNIGNVINVQFTHIISRVMFPAYSALQDDREDLKRAYLKTIKFITIFSFPFCIALISLSREFVLTLYGQKWMTIIPLIQLLGFAQILAPIFIACGSLYRGCGKPSYDFRINLACLCLQIPLMIILTKNFGLTGTVAAGIITVTIFSPISVFLAQKLVGFKWLEFFIQLIPSAFCSLVMFSVIFLVKRFLDVSSSFTSSTFHNFISLGFFSLVGILAYAGTFFIVDRPTSLEVKRMIFDLNKA